jgi:rhodanese-related sulfurtransferase
MMQQIDITQARALVHGPAEIAFLDLREAGQFGEGHALFATPAPYSRIEAMIGGLVPRLDAPILLIDAGDGVSERAAARIESLGYSDIRVARGGMPAWEAAGFPVYKGVNVASKTLGELAEALWHPQMITATELAEWQREGRSFDFFDTRPTPEYEKMRVPGAQSLPNGELPYRLGALAKDRPIVLTCAGRTRGIVGAIGAALVGAGKRVRALENGTQGWALAGGALERGNTALPLPEPTFEQKQHARAQADELLARWGLARITADALAAWQSDRTRTTYLFDVRTTHEAASDPVAAAEHALGVQLVQATDQWVGVRRARIVLCCDTGLRAGIAAFWLHQLGYEVAVAVIDDGLRALPARLAPFAAPPSGAASISAAQARAALAKDARLIDLRPSQAYRTGHVAGAVWGCRPRLAALARATGPNRAVLLVAETDAIAGQAAHDLRAAGLRHISVVTGGHAALVQAGCAVQVTPRQPADADCIDFLFFVHDRHDGNLDAMRRYLDWETGLVAQLDAVERAEYRLLAPAG